MLLCSSTRWEVGVDLAGKCNAWGDLAFVQATGDASVDVVEGGLVGHAEDDVGGAVGGEVTAAAESVAAAAGGLWATPRSLATAASVRIRSGPVRPGGRSTAARRGVPCGPVARFVPTDPTTLQSIVRPNTFVIGDAAAIPTSKAGSDTPFEGAVLTGNIARFLCGGQVGAGHTQRPPHKNQN